MSRVQMQAPRGGEPVEEIITFGKYQIGEMLGKGAFGKVFRALNTETGDFYAIKQIEKGIISANQLPGIQRECSLLQTLHHPNIVQFIEAAETQHHLYYVLEYVEGGSLYRTTKRFGSFPEPLLAGYISQVLTGLGYLHDKGVIHRDIKGENLLLTKQGTVKLADFGSCTYSAMDKMLTVIGTPFWMAPEIIEMDGNARNTACDIWSLGCTLIELVTGSPPYWEIGAMPAMFAMVNDAHPPLPKDISPELRDFLLACFTKDIVRRPSAPLLLTHPWILTARKKEETILPTIAFTSQNVGEVHNLTKKVQELMDENDSLNATIRSLKLHVLRMMKEKKQYKEDVSVLETDKKNMKEQISHLQGQIVSLQYAINHGGTNTITTIQSSRNGTSRPRSITLASASGSDENLHTITSYPSTRSPTGTMAIRPTVPSSSLNKTDSFPPSTPSSAPRDTSPSPPERVSIQSAGGPNSWSQTKIHVIRGKTPTRTASDMVPTPTIPQSKLSNEWSATETRHSSSHSISLSPKRDRSRVSGSASFSGPSTSSSSSSSSSSVPTSTTTTTSSSHPSIPPVAHINVPAVTPKSPSALRRLLSPRSIRHSAQMAAPGSPPSVSPFSLDMSSSSDSSPSSSLGSTAGARASIAITNQGLLKAGDKVKVKRFPEDSWHSAVVETMLDNGMCRVITKKGTKKEEVSLGYIRAVKHSHSSSSTSASTPPAGDESVASGGGSVSRSRRITKGL
eukprot:TRINITY_DN1545_c0_g2_i1.p1 TRINITY_DN1545_c0_g2~~TRINITY_DN1545_c0_g2_i1.p1  ORF type:complete len:736 (+),score=171.38 TRINITY_DN1545_c0_g2_i1:127-2334(+)